MSIVVRASNGRVYASLAAATRSIRNGTKKKLIAAIKGRSKYNGLYWETLSPHQVMYHIKGGGIIRKG